MIFKFVTLFTLSTLKFYYPSHQISIYFPLSSFPIFFFLPLGLCMWEEFFCLSFSFILWYFFILWFYFFPAKFICLVIQLLSVSQVLLLFLVPDRLFICHQVHHGLLAEHLQLLDIFSSENAGCYHHWYN